MILFREVKDFMWKRDRITIRKFSESNLKGIFFVLGILILLESFIEFPELDLNAVVRYVLTYVDFCNHKKFLTSIIKFLIPQIGVLLIWGNYFHENIVKNNNIIFTRTRKMERIIWRYIKELFLGVTVMTGVFELGICLIYLLKGNCSDNVGSLLVDLWIYNMYMNCILIITNLLALFIKEIYSILIILSIQLISLEMIYTLINKEVLNKVYYLIPTSSVLLSKNAEMGNSCKIGSGLYLLLLIMVTILLGCAMARKKEYLEER